ncbi:unnamed protein product [Parajaminaea phylloscopi]
MLSSSQYGGASRSAGGPSLSDLVSQSRKLTSSIERERNHAAGSYGGGLPSIHLGLDQLESQSRSLAAGDATMANATDAKAHYFLASAGIDAFTLAQSVNQANIASAFEPLEPVQDTDVQGYLQHEQQQTILSAIDEGRRETLEDFNKSLCRSMHSRWSKQKKRIFEELGQHQLGRSSDPSGLSASTRPLAGRAGSRLASLPPGGSSGAKATDPPLTSLSMHTKLMSLDSLIRSLNQNRLNGTPFPLASALARLAETSRIASGETQSQLVECWTALQKIIGEEGPHVPRERHFSSSYFDPSSYYGSQDGKKLRAKLTRGARRFLEGQFELHIDNVIAANPAKAQLGGQPGIASRVAAFLRASQLSREGRWAPELELVAKSGTSTPLPFWATIYHLVRTGHSSEALRQVEDHEESLRKNDAGFLGWFKEWVDGGEIGLSRASRDRFFAEFNARFRNLALGGAPGGDVAGVDPHKVALYRLIGRVDPTRKFPNALTRSTENWLWIQLMMTRESPVGAGEPGIEEYETDDREKYTLEDLARKLKQYGEAHFDPKGRRPLHYFLVLLLCGEFERAVAFLYTRPQHQTDAVHFAIALTYYGLLRCPSPEEARGTIGAEIFSTRPDVTGLRQVPSLDFARIITRHIRLFSASDAKSALEYIYLICLNVADEAVPAATQEDQRAKCYDAIKDLVCQTRMYAELVGDVRVDGARVPGAIEQSLGLLKIDDEREYLRQIVRSAAAQSESEHRTRDAILLFNLAEEYDRVVTVLNRELGASLFLDAGNAAADLGALNPQVSLSATGDSAQLAAAVLDTYESQPHILRRVDASKRQTTRLLLSLKKAVALARAGEAEKSLSTIEGTNVFPLDANGDVVAISRRAEAFFRDNDESLGRNLGELLLLTMDLLYKVHASAKPSSGSGSGSGTGNSAALILSASTTKSASASGSSAAEGREAKMQEMRNKARALMMFAGMLRFRIEQAVFAQLVRLDAFIR